MAIDKLVSNIEVLIEAPGGVDLVREAILGLAVDGKLLANTDFAVWEFELTLKDLGRMIRGITYAKAESSKGPSPQFVPLLGAANIQRSINYEGMTYVSSKLIKPDQYLKDGDVLICMSSGSKHLVGKAGVVNNPPTSSFGAFCGVFRITNETHRDYLKMFFKSPKYRSAVSAASRGIGINNLRVGDIEEIRVSIPPLTEQKRIIAKVDELMALCDQLEERKNQRDKLRTAARESAINAISTAQTPEELDAAWRRINNNWEVIADKQESVDSLRELIHDFAVNGFTSNLAKFNEVKLGDLSVINYGYTDSAKPAGVGPKFLRITDIQKGAVNWDDVPYCEISEQEEEKQVLRSGDIVFARTGATTGKSFLLVDPPRSVCASYLIRLRVDKSRLNPDFLYLYFQSGRYWREVREGMSGTAQGGFNSSKLGKMRVPLPTLNEQLEIVRRTRELKEICDQLEAGFRARGELAEKFARSILEVA